MLARGADDAIACFQPAACSRATHSAAPGSGFEPSLASQPAVLDLLGVANALDPLGARVRAQPAAQDEVVLLAERLEELLHT